MADTRLTKVSVLRALQLCAFGVLCPRKVTEAERGDEEIRKGFPQPPPPQEPRAFRVRRAFWASLILVVCSIAVGYGAGATLRGLGGPGTSKLVGGLQIVGATLVLWATLFVRGWDIQSIGGVTLTERVNQWLYRALYCLGTGAVVASLALAP